MSQTNILFAEEGITDSRRIIHTPGDFVKKNLLYVQEVGKLKSLKTHKCQRENLASYLFFCVTEGRGSVITRGKHYEMKKGDCILLNCMERYEHQSSEEEPWELAWVHYNGMAAMDYYTMFLEKNRGENLFTPEDIGTFNRMIDDLMQLQAQKDLLAELESSKVLIEFQNAILACVMQQKGVQDEHSINLNEVREYLNEHYREESVAEDVAAKEGIGEEDLNALFKNAYGIDLHDYVLNRRFNVAKELLRFSIKPVKDVIEESGIRNSDLFRRLFLDSEGMSAEEYRMKWAQWVK
ncbi:MAG: AraC family transcriptional regulator [Lachnospiraceae bacterium]|nr:AraC family transcriptional regulator [Lachnospiraceae bacterium]